MTQARGEASGYRVTFLGCGLGYVCQAAVVNLAPLLFVPLRAQFGFSYTQMGALVLINFLTQLAADIGFSPLVDRLGFRFFMVLGHTAATLGFVAFACVPFLPGAPFAAFAAATFIFSFGGGILELTISPVVNAMPAKEKSATMSLMHGFYSWGQVSVALLTTLFLFAFGAGAWPVVFLLWTLLPLFNIFLFARCPMPRAVPAERRSSALSVLRTPRFILLFALMLCAGASEQTISQWTSVYMEDVFALPKIVGDVGGMCLFALAMGAARTLNGVFGKARYMRRLMLFGSGLALLCYMIVGFTNWPLAGLAACAASGLGVSLLWPGTLSESADVFPLAGSWMMAILAAGGDAGCSVGPWLAGLWADGFGLRIGVLSGAVFPFMMVVLLLALGRRPAAKR